MPVAYNEKTGEALALSPDGAWVKARVAKNPQTGAIAVEEAPGQWKEIAAVPPVAPETAAARPQQEGPGVIEGAIRSLNEGVSLGWGDEIGAVGQGIENLIRGQPFDYDKNVEAQRARRRAFVEDSPIIAGGLEFAGSMVPSMLVPASSGARALPLMERVARGAAVGAGVGAIQGAGASEGGLENRLEGAAQGSAIGGALGGALPAAGAAISGPAGLVMNAIRRGAAPEEVATRKMIQALERSEMTPGQAFNRLEELGPDSVLADISPAMRGLAGSMARLPGKTEQVAQDVLGQRAAATGQRVRAGAREDLMTHGDMYEALDDLMKKRAQDAAPLYAQAHSQSVPLTDNLKAILSTPAGKDALARATRMMRNEENATLDLAGNPTVKALDYVKSGLDDVLESYRDKTTGKLVLDREGRGVESLRRKFIDEMDQLSPEYAQARKAWSGPTAAIDAVNKGRQFLTKDSEITQRMIRGMTPTEREFFLEGVTRAIDEKIASGESVAAIRRTLKNDLAQKRLQAAFPDMDSYNKFMKRLRSEDEYAQTRNTVLGGSQTAARLAQQGDADTDVPMSLLTAAARGDYGSALGTGVRFLARLGSVSEPQRNEIGRMLFSTDRGEQVRALEMMGQTITDLNVQQARSLYRQAFGAGYFGGATGAEKPVR